jgi:hypothetical protein
MPYSASFRELEALREFTRQALKQLKKLLAFIESKNASASVENEVGTYKGSGASGVPYLIGWATVTVNSSDPRVHKERNDFFRKLEAEQESLSGL